MIVFQNDGRDMTQPCPSNDNCLCLNSIEYASLLFPVLSVLLNYLYVEGVMRKAASWIKMLRTIWIIYTASVRCWNIDLYFFLKKLWFTFCSSYHISFHISVTNPKLNQNICATIYGEKLWTVHKPWVCIIDGCIPLPLVCNFRTTWANKSPDFSVWSPLLALKSKWKKETSEWSFLLWD